MVLYFFTGAVREITMSSLATIILYALYPTLFKVVEAKPLFLEAHQRYRRRAEGQESSALLPSSQPASPQDPILLPKRIPILAWSDFLIWITTYSTVVILDPCSGILIGMSVTLVCKCVKLFFKFKS